jgi:hypothetical protein
MDPSPWQRPNRGSDNEGNLRRLDKWKSAQNTETMTIVSTLPKDGEEDGVTLPNSKTNSVPCYEFFQGG